MKKLLMVAGVCLVLARFAFGQWTQQARVNVPFDFIVGSTVLPAGTYTLSTRPGESGAVLKFANTDTGVAAFAGNIDISVKPHTYNQTSSLVFVLDAQGRHVLHQVWIMGDSHGHDLKHEKGIAEPK